MQKEEIYWATAKIEEVAEVNPRLVKNGISEDLLVSFVPMPAVGAGDGSINVSTVRPFSEVKKGFTSFQQGDVLFAKITPCMENGKMAIVPKVKNGYAFGSTEFHVLRPKPGIDARYLYYYVSSRRFRGEAEHQMSGAVGQKRVPTQYLRECLITVAPPHEQTRIVAEIEKQFSRLDEAVANLKRVKANLKRYKAAVLKAAVEGKLTEEWRKQHSDVEPADKLLERILTERRKAAGKGKYKEPVGPDTSGLPELPAGWVWASLEQVGSVQLGKMLDKQKHKSGQKLPYLRNVNVRWGAVDTSDVFEMFFEEKELSRFSVEKGDVLVCEGGEPGRAAIWDGHLAGMKYQKALHRVRFYTDYEPNILIYLLEYLAKSGRLKSWFTGSTIKHFTRESFAVLPLPIPPHAEQAIIVAEVERNLSIIAGTEAQVDANLRRADRLRQSILKQAFSGQLVPQDSNDEPAGVLLARIRNADVGAPLAEPGPSPRPAPRPQSEHPERARQAAPLRESEGKASSLDAVIAAILTHMQPGREYARADLVEPLGLTTGQWNTAIQELKRVGKVRQVGEKRGARYFLNAPQRGGQHDGR